MLLGAQKGMRASPFAANRLVAVVADTMRTRGRGVKNAFARRAPERIVVLESDDWGSQRVPSKSAMERLRAMDILSGKSAYDRETLENREDLGTLCEVLSSVRDSTGRPAVLTCFVNPVNPDFNRIRASEFESYSWEPTSSTLERRGDRAEVQAAWRTGRADGLLALEYHGREHLQVRLWLEHLKTNAKVRAAFDEGYSSVPVDHVPQVARGFRAAYFFESEEEIPELEEIIIAGAQVFAQEYGGPATVFCPPNNIFHPRLYGAVKRAGCKGIIRHTRNVQPDGKGGAVSVWGQQGVSEAGLSWYGRNAMFEPEQGFGADHALAQIRSAFAWGVPAIVSTHRVNYVGGIDPAVRSRGATALRELLQRIVSSWPDVRFMTSRELLAALTARG